MILDSSACSSNKKSAIDREKARRNQPSEIVSGMSRPYRLPQIVQARLISAGMPVRTHDLSSYVLASSERSKNGPSKAIVGDNGTCISIGVVPGRWIWVKRLVTGARATVGFVVAESPSALPILIPAIDGGAVG